ncbi:MAG: hypothetical protein P1V35_07225 [Planctomycetota bacterium]|nr:hypothetical protein [Planctomycetota bacterium]
MNIPINKWGPPDRQPSKKGSALVSTLVVFVGISSMIYATTALSSIEVKESRQGIQKLQTDSIAQAGVEMGKVRLQETIRKTSILNPIEGVAELFNGPDALDVFRGEPLVDNGATVGSYSVSMRLLEETNTSVTVQIFSTGYLGDAPADLNAGAPVEASSSLAVTVRYELESSEVFDYAYFINNWGWLYGHTIYCNGNARSNGQFDSGGYKPTMTGQPTYDSAEFDGSVASLGGYRDDNGDGLEDGDDGGVFSGWDIVNVQNVRGNGGNAENQHDFQEQVPMPNLSDLSLYEDAATDQGGSISVGGSMVVDGVLGDDSGEKSNLYLVGTPANPIVLDGPVVIRGDVIISGTVTGQGAIYNSGNIYVPDSLNYLNGPNSVRPADNTQASTEAWLADNWDKDFLGLFSAENVVVGDYTNNSWRHYVGGWMASNMNSSIEDAGEDGIPNTYAGRDGIMGTADDDILEGDGIFTVEHYSEADAALGIIPDGFAVGDIIPGSGEDIDGDGKFDGQSSLNDLDMQDSMTASKWEGNMPAAGIGSYSSIASLYANNLDATFYTNHSFCYFVLGGQPARINGSMVARNENIVYGTPSIEMNYDSRLLGGSSGAAGTMLPTTVAPLEVIQWRRLDEDPLFHMEEIAQSGTGEVTP